jgi:streptogramin lyase
MTVMTVLGRMLAGVIGLAALGAAAQAQQKVELFELPAGAGPHDVGPAPDGTVWYTAQLQGVLGVVYVDDHDIVWLSDFGANAAVRFEPGTQAFKSFEGSAPGANVRQILGRPGEVRAPDSGTDRLMLIRTAGE